jgi:hypothetical protein
MVAGNLHGFLQCVLIEDFFQGIFFTLFNELFM